MTGAVNDWNAQPDTAEFLVQGNFNAFYDMNIVFWDTVFDSGDPSLLGIALPGVGLTPQTATYCDPNACTWQWGEAHLGDDGHSGPWGTDQSRHATIVHELGHLLSLRHESVNANETQLYECGFDNTGSIPLSIMSYDCIDPPAWPGLWSCPPVGLSPTD